VSALLLRRVFFFGKVEAGGLKAMCAPLGDNNLVVEEFGLLLRLVASRGFWCATALATTAQPLTLLLGCGGVVFCRVCCLCGELMMLFASACDVQLFFLK
jgi:hypothetical protein